MGKKMTSNITDRLNGVATSVAFKVPVRVATTANITLSGLQTIDGETLLSGDRVLVKDQTDTIVNGLYTALAGDWVRTTDFDGSYDAVGGTQIYVDSGAVAAGKYYLVDGSGPIAIGTDAITFSVAMRVDIDEAAISAAAAAAEVSRIAAEDAETGALAAQAGAEAAEDIVVAAADAAEAINSGMDFASFAAGVSGTTTGQVFYVVVNGYRQFYKNGTSTDADDIYYYTGPQYAAKTPALLIATTRAFATGDTLNTADGHIYTVADPSTTGPITYADQTGYHVITAGGVKLFVQPNSDGFFHSRAFGIEPSSNNTVALTAFLTAGLGRKCMIDHAVGDYRANYLPLYTGSVVVLEPGVRIVGLGTGEATIFRSYTTSSTNIVLSGYGAYIEMPAGDTSQTLNFGNAPENVLVEGVKIKGPAVGGYGSESDCIYIGGTPDDNVVAKNIVIRDVIAYHSRRNILSVVACHGFLAENCDLSETLVGGVFKRIVDFEANRYMANGEHSVKAATLRKCRIHDSQNGGVLVSWAQQITIDDCDIYDILGYGVQLSPGGNIFNSDRNTRPGDVLGVVSIASATGWITVSTSAKLTDDYGIQPGTYCARATRDGGAWPAEISGGFYVEDISADQFSMRVSVDWGFPILTTTGTGSAGTGSFDEDGDVSALWIGVYVDDDQVEVKNTRIWDTTDHCISVVGFGVTVQDCKLWPASAKYGVNVQNARDVSVLSNKIYGNGLAQRGIIVQGCSEFATNDNTIIGTTKAAIYLSGATGCRLKDDKCTGCDSTANEGVIYINSAKRWLVDGAVMRNTTALPSKYGIRTGSNTENGLAINVDGYTTGSSTATSISIGSGTGNRSLNCWKKDGTWNT
jgi:hypothetical protein